MICGNCGIPELLRCALPHKHARIYGIAIVAITLFLGAKVPIAAWPLPYHGQTINTQEGVLVDFADGNRAGGLTIRTASGATQNYSTSRTTTFQHRHIACFTMPSATMKCTDWPARIVPNKTVVRVAYFIGENEGPGIAGPMRIATDVSAK